MTNIPLTAEDVRAGYRMVLGRDPETPEIVAFYVASSADRDSFRRALLGSQEFAYGWGAVAFGQLCHDMVFAPPAQLDYEISDDLLARMLERIRRQWTLLGEQDPYWSVLAHEDFRAGAVDAEALGRFNESGIDWATMVDLFAERTERPAGGGVCLELGCGVGRITQHLAGRFDRVVGVDISPGNLALCRSHLADRNIDNVDLIQVSGIEDFEVLPPFDFFYSMIVLQHNPPPIQLTILRRIFERLNPGGGVLFQIPASMPSYVFDADAYLDSPHAEMEMHGLPRHVVLTEMQAHDIEVIDMVPDPFAGGIGSFTFYGIKRVPPPEPEPVRAPPRTFCTHPFGGLGGRIRRHLRRRSPG